MTPIEQNRVRRDGVGLRACDPDRACPGYTLYAPLAGDGTVYLLDLQGAIVHTWRLPYPPGLYGCLTPAGTLLYNGQTNDPPGTARFISAQPWKGGVVLEADWDGRIRWEVRHPDHHHDGILLRNGNVLLLCLAAIPRDLVPLVQGGVPDSEYAGDVYADTLVELTTAGAVVWEWRSWEHLDPATDRITAEQELRHEWTHGNAVAELPDGDLVVSFRNISTVAIVARATGAIIWKLGGPPLAHQHAPTPLPNGNLLIFDNGTHRLDHPLPFSRVIEVERTTRRIVWSYQDRPPANFYSPFISGAGRLPNGNTLICEGNFGRLFEVTAAGETVWEYVNPHFGASGNVPGGAPTNGVFRAFRYSAAEIERARRTAR